jgi:polyvinyl alcohol dehydrogenase (cytochrome)
MQEQGAALSDPEKQRVAEFMAGRPMGSTGAGDAASMPNRCQENPPLELPSRGPVWNGWGRDSANTRYQPFSSAGLTSDDVRNLTLKWAFGFPFGESSNAQPSVVAGRVFAGSDNGYVYSLDAETGCVYWSFETASIVRNSPVVGPVAGIRDVSYAVYFGDGHGNAYALDARTGRLIWKTRTDEHFLARITAGLALYEGRVFVPVSSSEEFRSGNAWYPCCTSRGSVVALDAATGEEIWKAWVVPGSPKPWVTQDNGVGLYRPGGGAVWSTPTVDPVRNAIYFGTGDATTPPSPITTDGVMAVDIDTGELLWSYQATENDVFMGGCGQENRSLACPEQNGPDADIGNSPILTTLPDGQRILLTGTKGGDLFALDPDDNGRLLYRVGALGEPAIGPQGRGRGRGSIVWGGAVDDQFAYYGLGRGGLAAIRAATGEYEWTFTPPEGGSLGAAPTAIPGVVFEGATNGMLYAVSAVDGTLLWQFDTSGDFETVNEVPAHGGALQSIGAVVADGMVFIGSGYAISSGASGGNVLLAFSVGGR